MRTLGSGVRSNSNIQHPCCSTILTRLPAAVAAGGKALSTWWYAFVFRPWNFQSSTKPYIVAKFSSAAAAAGPQLFLQTVEDLLWLLLRTPRPEQDFQRLFVHCLNDTVVRMPRRLYRKPGAQPWLGDFPIEIRLGLVSHLAAVIGGTGIRQRLLVCPQNRFAFETARCVVPDRCEGIHPAARFVATDPKKTSL
jgi:hypothetical protein